MSRSGRLTAAVMALALGVAAFAAAPVRADVGALGPTYSSSKGTATAPTGEKPQTKLWFNDGAWWAVMYDASTANFEIYKRVNGSWTTTGTIVDPRDGSWQDVLWDGNHLQVVSAGNRATNPGAGVRYSRFGYDSGAHKYVVEIPPTTLTNYGVEVAVMDRDSTGKIWVTFTHNSQVYVTHSTTDQATWATPFVVPGGAPANVSADDISSIVAYNGRIGLMWSDQAPNGTGQADNFYWATHVDGQADDAWQVQSAFSGIEMADDHIDLKALDNDPAGQVFAAVKTSLNRAADPQTLLLWLDNANTWHSTTVLRVSDGTPTRAQVAIDKGRRELYVLASEGPCCNGGAIFIKKTSLDAIAFPVGAGTPVIQSSTDLKINNVDTPRDPVDASTGLPVLAGDDSTHHYWHTLIPLDGTDIVPPETTIVAGPAGTTASTSAQFSFSASEPGSTFACSLDGAPFGSCTSAVVYSSLAASAHTFQVRATDAAGNVDPTPATRSWTVASTPSLFADDFESGGLGQWTTVLTGAGGSAAVQSATVAAGAFAARLSAPATTGAFAYARQSLPGAPTSLTVSGTFRIDGEGAAGGNVPLLRLFDPAGKRLVSLYRPNGNTKIYIAHSGISATTTGRLPAATFERFELAVTTAGDGASTLTVRIDGAQVYATSTASLGTAGVGALQIGNDTKSQAFVVVADDVEAR